MAASVEATGHQWKFFRYGGIDQVGLETGADLAALEQLDPKLWAALSCPVNGLEFDRKTLELLDADHDQRVRVPEILAAVKWLRSVLVNLDELPRRPSELPLGSISEATPEGRTLLASARQVLANLGKPGATTITVEDVADTARIFAATRFNGDGIITPEAADDDAIRKVIGEIAECFPGAVDRSGKPGIATAQVDQFFAEARAFVEWHDRGTREPTLLPMKEQTGAAAELLAVTGAKIDDFFARCRLAAFDQRAQPHLNRHDRDFEALAARQLSLAAPEVAEFPLARVEAGRALPLREGVNPAWVEHLGRLQAEVVGPLVGASDSLTLDQWQRVKAAFGPFNAWQANRPVTAVAKLGRARLGEILDGGAEAAIRQLIAQDLALEPQANAIAELDRLVRYHRYLHLLLCNFVAFRDFYAPKSRAIFQAGTLYLDGRSCDLCIRVEYPDRHAAMAGMCNTYLAYCDCSRKGTAEKFTIAAAFTAGDGEQLMVGRNGIFIDRQGRDWEAVVTRLVPHPISIGEAFWAPYRKLAAMVGEQLEKFAASKDKAVETQMASGVATAVTEVETRAAGGVAAVPGARPAAPPAAPFDVGRFAGIFAAIGLAIGAIGTAIASVVTGFMGLSWWQMPLAIAGILLAVSGPSMLMAALRLRRRNLGPLLDANGWAVNTRAAMNLKFAASLTREAELPQGSRRCFDDPFAEPANPWPRRLFWAIVLGAVLALGFNWREELRAWLAVPPVAGGAVVGVGSGAGRGSGSGSASTRGPGSGSGRATGDGSVPAAGILAPASEAASSAVGLPAAAGSASGSAAGAGAGGASGSGS